MKTLQMIFVALALALTTAPAFPVDWSRAESVAQRAVDVSPSLAAVAAEIEAAQQRVLPAGALPNPMLMGGVQNQTVDLSYDFMTMYMVGASQTLVRKARRDALRTSAELDVERLRRRYEARKAEVERDARIAYLDAAAAQNQIAGTEEIARLLKSVADAARIQYETGAAPQADLIRATLEQSTIEHQLLVLRRQRQSALSRLLPLLQLAPEVSVPPFALDREMERSSHGREAGVMLPDATPAIAELQADVAVAEQELRLAKLAGKPDFNVEASYGFRPRDTDMINVVARIELPVRRSTIIEPRIREAMLRKEAALQQIRSLRLQLEQDLGDAAALRNEAIEQIELHHERLVPTARIGFESALVSYQNGKTSFDSVLGSLRTWIALSVDYYDFVRQRLNAEAGIEAIRHGARSGMVAPAVTMRSQ